MDLRSVRKARAQLELRLAMAVQRASTPALVVKKLNKGNVGPLLSGAGNLVTAEPDKV